MRLPTRAPQGRLLSICIYNQFNYYNRASSSSSKLHSNISQALVPRFIHSLATSQLFHSSLQSNRFIRRASTSRSSSPLIVMPPIKETIELTDLEQGLFSDLLSAIKEARLDTTLRCAGGWVRDKLMGRESLDIDIALDNMLGKEFAECINEYLKSHGQETHNVAVIMSNPEQSKHLETARMKIHGVWIDLVNLRSEEYAHHSRIPTMEFGTPEQDAYRRDFTINSLFYNINKGIVEDFTGKGIDDLKEGIIRTPLPPKETFLDDPLRVLRAVRFASRFGFTLEDTLLSAAQDSQVRDMLGHKVSRERIGTELEGMLKGADPIRAIELLKDLGLFEAVFEVHPSASDKMLTEEFARAGSKLFSDAHEMWTTLHNNTDTNNGSNTTSTITNTNSGDVEEQKRQMMIAALLLPLRSMKLKNAKGKPQSMSSHIIRDSLKWKARDADSVDALHAVVPRIAHVYHLLQDNNNTTMNDDTTTVAIVTQLGRCMRDLKTLFVPGIILSSFLSSPEATPLGVDPSEIEDHVATLKTATTTTNALDHRMEMCSAILKAVDQYELNECWTWKPIMDGKRVMKVMGMEKGGPELGKLMDKVVDWQLLHPHGSVEECEAWLVEEGGKTNE